MLIRDVLVNIMHDEGFTQNDVAKRLKISRQAMSQMLHGDNDIRLSNLIDILDVLGYSFKIVKRKRYEDD